MKTLDTDRSVLDVRWMLGRYSESRIPVHGYSLNTVEGPYGGEDPYPPPTNREYEGWENTSFDFEVTMFNALIVHGFVVFVTVHMFMLPTQVDKTDNHGVQ